MLMFRRCMLAVSALGTPAPWAALSNATPAMCQAARFISSGHNVTALPAQGMVLDGRAVAQRWCDDLAIEARQVTAQLGRQPSLSVILVGERADSMLYVSRKQEACQRAGILVTLHKLPETVTQQELEEAMQMLCSDCNVDAVLLQLPLPRHLDDAAVMEYLDPAKDVDGFHPLNMGRMLLRGHGPSFFPCTPLGILELLSRSKVEIQGKTCVVLGDSNVVGTPLAIMLRDHGAAAVTICHKISYKEWFEDQNQVRRKRAAAAACMPRLPGPSGQPSYYAEHHPPALSQSLAAASASHIPSVAPPQSSPAAAAAAAAAAAGASSQANQTQPSIATATTTKNLPSSHSPSAPSTLQALTAAQGHAPTESAHDNTEAGVPVSAGERHMSEMTEWGSFQSYQLPDITRTADILVVAVGHPELVKQEWVKPGAVVIDVGINVVSGPAPRHHHHYSDHHSHQLPDHHGASSSSSTDTSSTGTRRCTSAHTSSSPDNSSSSSSSRNGFMSRPAEDHAACSISGPATNGSTGAQQQPSRQEQAAASHDSGHSVQHPSEHFPPGSYHVIGDVDFREVIQVASAITPVPGGVGPMTIAAVLHNTITAARRRLCPGHEK